MSFQDFSEIDHALRAGGLSAHALHTIWEQRQPVPVPARHQSAQASLETKHVAWLQEDVALARAFTTLALKQEEFLLVCDAAREALRLWPALDEAGRIELVGVHLDYAAALTRLGRLDAARRELEPYVRADFRSTLPATLHVDLFLRLGDILREESRQSIDAAGRAQAAQEALEYYEQALRIEPDRLEALTLSAAASLVLSSPGSAFRVSAHERARQIFTRVSVLEESAPPTWLTRESTAVAHAVLGDLEEATAAYHSLATLEEKTVARLAAARYWAEFLAKALNLPADYFRAAFPPLRLLVFSGHLPDLPGTPSRFSLAAVANARQQLRSFLGGLNACVALCSAAAGADLLLIEALLEREGTLHLVLPWAEEEFRRTSITPYEPKDGPPIWGPIFDRALREAATVRQVGQMYRPDSDAGWDYVMEVTAGLALYTARMSRLDVQPVVFWDRQPGRGAGGTAAFHEFWRQQLQQDPIILDPPPLPAETKPFALDAPRQRSERDTLQQQVKSILFADIVGYSKLMEKFIPQFVEIFLGRVSRLAASSEHAPRSLNTWGDAVYAVFDYAHDAGCFALELLAMIRDGEAEWLKAGLYWEEPSTVGGPATKHPLNVRVGLHTGPVFIHYDPVVRHLRFTGTHVNRAARIEPVAAPGEVYASEEFVALAELDAEIKARAGSGLGKENFAGEYAGTMQLAKGYPGWYRIYRLVPTRVLALDALARDAHVAYCLEAQRRGETLATNPALKQWDELDEDYRQANRAQIADIANKLRLLGYELTLGQGLHPSEIVLPHEVVETLSIREHTRWMKERQRQGWTHGHERDNARKLHPMLVGWNFLSELERDKDRETIRNLPRFIEQTGFRVKKLDA